MLRLLCTTRKEENVTHVQKHLLSPSESDRRHGAARRSPLSRIYARSSFIARVESETLILPVYRNAQHYAINNRSLLQP